MVPPCESAPCAGRVRPRCHPRRQDPPHSSRPRRACRRRCRPDSPDAGRLVARRAAAGVRLEEGVAGASAGAARQDRRLVPQDHAAIAKAVARGPRADPQHVRPQVRGPTLRPRLGAPPVAVAAAALAARHADEHAASQADRALCDVEVASARQARHGRAGSAAALAANLDQREVEEIGRDTVVGRRELVALGEALRTQQVRLSLSKSGQSSSGRLVHCRG